MYTFDFRLSKPKIPTFYSISLFLCPDPTDPSTTVPICRLLDPSRCSWTHPAAPGILHKGYVGSEPTSRSSPCPLLLIPLSSPLPHREVHPRDLGLSRLWHAAPLSAALLFFSKSLQEPRPAWVAEISPVTGSASPSPGLASAPNLLPLSLAPAVRCSAPPPGPSRTLLLPRLLALHVTICGTILLCHCPHHPTFLLPQPEME